MSVDETNPGRTAASAKPLKGFRFWAQILGLSASDLTARVMLRAVFAGVLVTALALEGIRFGYVERPIPLASVYQDQDPVVARVGNELIRVSDAFAHAALVGEGPEEMGDVPTLIASGTVDETADQVALAQAARSAGVDDALEIRAALALAERQILVEAYLDQIASQSVTEAAIEERYAEESAELAANSVMRLSQILVRTADEAETVLARAPRASFASLAKQYSLDEDSKAHGGLIGDVRVADLPTEFASAAQDLSIGGVSDPIETDQGLVILKLESRRALRLPPLEERRDAIVEALQQEAIAKALAGAREEAPVRLREAGAVVAELPAPPTAETLAVASAY